MGWPNLDDIGEIGATGLSVLDVEIDEVTNRIISADLASGWNPAVYLNLGVKRWRPSAMSDRLNRVLYIHVSEEIPSHIVERLRLARSQGIGVTIALKIPSLFQPDVLRILIEVEADVFVLDDYEHGKRFVRRDLLLALADIGVPLTPELRSTIIAAVWPRIEEGSSQEKGRRLEAFLAFLFSQVSDLRVVEHNFRTETEEIDLVLQVGASSERAWQNSGVPFILVEAKNRVDKATQPMMSVFLTKLQTKRGTVKIGFMVSLGGFTEDARMQELRFSTHDICVVMLDRQGIETLLDTADLDKALDTVVRRALMR